MLSVSPETRRRNRIVHELYTCRDKLFQTGLSLSLENNESKRKTLKQEISRLQNHMQSLELALNSDHIGKYPPIDTSKVSVRGYREMWHDMLHSEMFSEQWAAFTELAWHALIDGLVIAIALWLVWIIMH